MLSSAGDIPVGGKLGREAVDKQRVSIAVALRLA